MLNKLVLVATVSVVTIVSSSLSAQMGRPERPIFSEADTDGNGTLSKEEMAASHPNNSVERISEVFATLDVDGDGVLAYDEYYRGRSRED